ncbi:MAG TPA: chorismate synthase [Candidatus Enterenecus merdae]|nr:chorismate synthase [Candidatus Enterenecus merdae]
MKYTIFGESHGPAIGVTLSGIPAGIELDLAAIQRELDRRAPGRNPWSTARKEADRPELLSGVFEGKTTGAPLCAVIANTDTRSQDYARTKDLARPGHADYPAFVRYGGFHDYRGGGHFSGRLTAPLVFAGAVAKQVLALRGVRVGGHISSIYGICDDPLEDWESLSAAADKPFPVLNDQKGEEMKAAIAQAREELDSVGGSVECAVFGLPPGLGSPDFGENAEGIFSQYLFAVPAVKAVAFGAGTAFSLMRGSEANDPLYVDEDGTVLAEHNCAGGINGGITNGMPLVFEATLRPTPSIARPQFTVDLAKGENAVLELRGRHDPCLVPRAVPVLEAAAALAACDLLGV